MQGGISREYQVNWTGLDSGGSTERHSADRGGGASGLRKSSMHPQRRPRCPAAVVWAVEEQQNRVAAPLEKVGTLVLGIHQQPAEDGVEEVTQLLGAFPAAAGQPLGEWGEAGDVEQEQASIDDSMGRPQLGCCPRGQQPRHVRRRGRTLPERRQPGVASVHSSL